MARFERVPFEAGDWEKKLGGYADGIVYQSSAWLAFLAESQNGEPVLAALKEGQETLGYFTGVMVKKLGLKILGSPFRGWTCPYMGFNLQPSVPRRVAAEAISDFAFKTLRCAHLEIVDPCLTTEDIAGLGFNTEMNATVVVDLTPTEEAILANMNSYRRRDIRRAEKHGVVIQEVTDAELADDFSNQLKDVFAKQGLVPTFGVERVRTLIKHLQPTGRLLMLRARDAEGHCIATGLFLGLGETAFYWGGASWRQYQNLHPNELIQWYSMRFWKRRGMKQYNLVGTMDFKRRFGAREITVPLIAKSRNRAITFFRATAPRVMKTALKLAWKLKSAGHRPASEEPA